MNAVQTVDVASSLDVLTQILHNAFFSPDVTLTNGIHHQSNVFSQRNCEPIELSD
jgi:hypothetical protein